MNMGSQDLFNEITELEKEAEQSVDPMEDPVYKTKQSQLQETERQVKLMSTLPQEIIQIVQTVKLEV